MHVQRIDQALNSLEQLIGQSAPPATFCDAFAQTAIQLLPGGYFCSVHWLGEQWLIEPLMGEPELDRASLRSWLTNLPEQNNSQHYGSCTHIGDWTFCLAARNSPRTSAGALLWQRSGPLDDSLTRAVFQMLGPLAELWENYWRTCHGQACESMRAAFTHELLNWRTSSQADELAFRLVSDLAVATRCHRCVLVETARPLKRAQALAVSGLADLKAQSASIAELLTSLSKRVPAQRYRTDSAAAPFWLSLQLGDRHQVIFQWPDQDSYLWSQAILSSLWPTLTQAWLLQYQAGRIAGHRLSWLPRIGLARLITLVILLILAIALWSTRNLPASLIVECPGTLEPVEQLWLFAPADGHIEQILVSDRELVAAGQVVALVAAPALDLQKQTLASELATLQQKKISLDVLLNESNSTTEAGTREARRIAGEILDIDLRVQGLQEQRKMLDIECEKLTVRSRISGRVVGGDLAQELNQKPVRTGDYLFRIVNEQKAWQLELDLPERDLGHVQQAMDTAANQLTIRFAILGKPGQSFRATVRNLRSAAYQADTHKTAIRLLADVEDKDLAQIPIGTQVLASIDAGPHPWWFVLARPAIESLQRRGWL